VRYLLLNCFIAVLSVIIIGCPGFPITGSTDYPNPQFIYSHPSFSPDGSKIVYIWDTFNGLYIDLPIKGTSGLWIMDADGENRTLLKSGQYLEYPTFNPDGNSVLFSKHNLYKIDIDGGNFETIYNQGWVRQSSWSPDGSRIIFSADTSERFHGMFLLVMLNVNDRSSYHFDWHSARPIGSSPFAFSPAWNPNGNSIIFFHHFEGICSVDLNGSNYGLVQGPGDLKPSLSMLSVSSDGMKLTHDMADRIWTVGINGENPTVIAKEGYFPSWSPDGSQIVYIAPDPEIRNARVIWIMDSDGSNKHPLTRATDEED
jgi:Tol biopolymer transport system component